MDSLKEGMHWLTQQGLKYHRRQLNCMKTSFNCYSTVLRCFRECNEIPVYNKVQTNGCTEEQGGQILKRQKTSKRVCRKRKKEVTERWEEFSSHRYLSNSPGNIIAWADMAASATFTHTFTHW